MKIAILCTDYRSREDYIRAAKLLGWEHQCFDYYLGRDFEVVAQEIVKSGVTHAIVEGFVNGKPHGAKVAGRLAQSGIDTFITDDSCFGILGELFIRQLPWGSAEDIAAFLSEGKNTRAARIRSKIEKLQAEIDQLSQQEQLAQRVAGRS